LNPNIPQPSFFPADSPAPHRIGTRYQVRFRQPNGQDKHAAKRFLKRELNSHVEVPRKILTDQCHNYPATEGEIREPANVAYCFQIAIDLCMNPLTHEP